MKMIEKELEQFEKEHNELNPIVRKNYQAILRMLFEKENMPKETLIQLAHRIKPLMYPKDGSSLPHKLYWSKEIPLTQSFYFSFNDDSLVKNEKGKIVGVDGLIRVSKFTCYHRCDGYYGILRPGMNEVIQQFPTYLLADKTAEYAVTLQFPSLNLRDVYDSFIDRHVSTVIVYRLKNGLPPEVRNQAVIY